MRNIAFALIFGCLALAASLLCFLPAEAKNSADIVDVEVGRDGENLEVSFRVVNCFTPKMEEAVRSGVSTTFRLLIVLEKKESPVLLVGRPPVLDVAIDHTIKYDRLKSEFRVHLPEHPEKELVTQDFEEAKRWMSTVNKVPVIPMWRLEKNVTYDLRLKAELSKIRLPLFLRYILFFVSLWDFETDWYIVTL